MVVLCMIVAIVGAGSLSGCLMHDSWAVGVM